MEQVLTLRTDTSSYTLTDVKAEIKECVKLLKAIGITEIENNYYNVKLSSRSVKNFGRCHKDSDHVYTITINKNYLRYGSSENIHNTIMHEVIHSVPNCMNHKEPWKKVARKVNQHYQFTPITRLGHDENYTKNYVQVLSYKYVVTCDKCGHAWKYRRKTNIVKHAPLGTCTCPYCKTKSFTVTNI